MHLVELRDLPLPVFLSLPLGQFCLGEFGRPPPIRFGWKASSPVPRPFIIRCSVILLGTDFRRSSSPSTKYRPRSSFAVSIRSEPTSAYASRRRIAARISRPASSYDVANCAPVCATYALARVWTADSWYARR